MNLPGAASRGSVHVNSAAGAAFAGTRAQRCVAANRVTHSSRRITSRQLQGTAFGASTNSDTDAATRARLARTGAHRQVT